jgi:hypothetical protein
MKSKLIRNLIIVNGFLIPIFIITILGMLIKETFFNGFDSYGMNDFEVETFEPKLHHSAPKPIPHSEYYYIAVSKRMVSPFDVEYIEDEFTAIPENTINLLFLDKDLNITGQMLETDASIKHMDIPFQYATASDVMDTKQYLAFLIAKDDSNSDGTIDQRDTHYLYISDLNGKHLKQVSVKEVFHYRWINDYKKLLLTYATDTLEYAVYDIATNTLNPSKTLNP